MNRFNAPAGNFFKPGGPGLPVFAGIKKTAAGVLLLLLF